MNITVLLSQDNAETTQKIAIYLRENGYEVISAESGEELCSIASRNISDLIITDIFFPDMNGIDVIYDIKAHCDTPVVVVSAVRTENEKVNAIDAGADDYIVRPFPKKEFLARLRAAVRRNKQRDAYIGEALLYKSDALEIDFEKRLVTVDSEPVHLTPVEYKIVELLCKYSGCVLTYEYILRGVWGAFVPPDNKILRVNMTNIRKKIEIDPKNPRYLHTESGIGYRIAESKH